jgi:hypothetical protein
MRCGGGLTLDLPHNDVTGGVSTNPSSSLACVFTPGSAAWPKAVDSRHALPIVAITHLTRPHDQLRGQACRVRTCDDK